MTGCIADETWALLASPARSVSCLHQDRTGSGLCENRAAQSPSCQCLESFIPAPPFKVRAAGSQNIFIYLLSPGLGEP